MQRLALVAVVLAAALTWAQDSPRIEVFAGYQFTNFNMAVIPDRQNAHGFNADATVPATDHVRLVADLGAAFKNLDDGMGGTLKARTYTYLFGPRYAVTEGRATPFVEALVGGHHLSVSQSGISLSENKFAVGLGGGLDVGVSEKLSLRLARFDYIFVRNAGTFGLGLPINGKNLHNLRLSTGIVFIF